MNSSEQQLGEEKNEGKEKQRGGRITSFTENSRICVLNFPFSNSISFLLHFQASESHTPAETKSEDVTDEGTITRGERNESKRKTEDGGGTDMRGDEEMKKPSPQAEGSGGRAECDKSDRSVEEGRDMNTAPYSELPLQREEDRGAQENRKPHHIITGENSKSAALKRGNATAASLRPEEMLKKWESGGRPLDKERNSKVPKETGKEETAS